MRRAAVLFVILAFAAASPSLASAQGLPSASGITINEPLFVSTVPSNMIVGQNYTIQVQITSTLKNAVTTSVVLGAPLAYILVNPFVQDVVVPPGQTVDEQFFLVAHDAHQGGLNITASLWITSGINGSSPQLVQTVSSMVYRIDRPFWPAAILGASIIVGAFALAVVYLRQARRRSSHESDLPAPAAPEQMDPLSSIPRLRAWRLALSGPMLFSYFSLLYLLLVSPSGTSLTSTLVLVVALYLYFANGFLMNDYADRENDIAAGAFSAERGHLLPRRALALLVLLTFGLGATTVLVLQKGIVFDLIWALAYLLSWMYSTPPAALKRRGFSGAACDSLIERPLPILAIFAFFSYYGLETFLFPLLAELTWSVFKHQVADFDLDVKAGLRTFAIALGKRRSERLLNYLFNPMGAVSLYVLLILTYERVPPARLGMVAAGILLSAGLFVATALRKSIAFRATPTDPPFVMVVNVAYKFLVLPLMAAYVLLLQPGFSLIAVIVAVSLAPHLTEYAKMITALRSRPRAPR